jgi:uncharacterized phiE125 gp8 family phage protein
MRIIRTTVAPITYPMTAAFTHAKIGEASMADLQAEMVPYVKAAFSEAELSGGIALITQPVRLELDEWPGGTSLSLPVGPVQAGAGCTVTVGGAPFTGFRLAHGNRPALVLSAPMPAGEVVITYSAGFGDDASSVPPDLLIAVLDQALVVAEMRGMGGLDRTYRQPVSPMFSRVLSRYRRVSI